MVRVVLAHSWLPVDGIEAAVELFGAGKFPLTKDRPNDENTADRGYNSDEDSQGCALGLGARSIALLIWNDGF